MLLDQLKAFHAVVKHGGFERASEAIHLSQPAISLRIKELENHLGLELFNRSGRRARLTDAGRIVEEYAIRFMIVHGEMNQAVAEFKGIQRGKLACGAPPTIAVHLLPKVLVQFKRRFPKIEVRLSVGSSPEIEKRLLAEDIEIGLVTAITRPGRFKTFDLLTDEFVLVVPRNHPLARRHVISLAHIKDIPLILRQAGSFPRSIIDEAFRRAGIGYSCTMEIETTEAVKRAVIEGLGCSIVSFSSIRTEIETGRLAYVRISGAPMKRALKVIMHKDRSISGPTKPFLQLLGVKIS